MIGWVPLGAEARLPYRPRPRNVSLVNATTIPVLLCGPGALSQAVVHVQRIVDADPDGHPDVREVAPVGDARIRIDQVREALLWARYGPVTAAHKVILVGPAERLSHEAASALLKSLEEAPAYMAYVLHARAPEHVLATIRSRCAVTWAGGIPDEEDSGVDRLPRILEELTAMSPEQQQGMIDARSLRERWQEATAEAEGLSLLELVEGYQACWSDPVAGTATAAAVPRALEQATVEDTLEGARRLAELGRDPCRAFLRALLLCLCRAGAGSTGGPAEANTVAWCRKLSLSRGEVERNANLRLLMEVVLLWPRRN